MKTISVESELYREYVYSDGVYRIEHPVQVHVMDNDSHRVIDTEGVTHRPSLGWLAIRWKPINDESAFVA